LTTDRAALNYHHLRYFWVVATEGSIVAASRRLRVSHPTVSAQISELEERLGVALFERRGRGLALTEAGRIALRYADEIFNLGSELVDALHGRSAGRLRLRVGVIDVVPKTVVHRLLEPAFEVAPSLHLVIREDRSLEGFLSEMATHDLDLVLADQPAGSGLPVRLYNHRLGESATDLVAAPELAARLREGFPASLDGAPAILPSSDRALRRALTIWFDAHDVRPEVVAEVDDSALVKVLAESGRGFCALPRVIGNEAATRHRLVRIGSTDVVQAYYAISAERRLVHPAVVAVSRAARVQLAPVD
jgi:LysR family transcriptional regulator, transcriptional activator of nhaA